MGRDERRKHQELFTQDKDVEVLVATDAAGEGINLQRAHLMVNYDLPWNPNRIEQRFGRIHRIGQAEVCHLWNLIAKDTREGEVFDTLFKKLEEERKALGGQVAVVRFATLFLCDRKDVSRTRPACQASRTGRSAEDAASRTRRMSAAARKTVSQRMKKYWEEPRDAKARIK
jgi:superfamily II DNA/RNA helicase